MNTAWYLLCKCDNVFLALIFLVRNKNTSFVRTVTYPSGPFIQACAGAPLPGVRSNFGKSSMMRILKQAFPFAVWIHFLASRSLYAIFPIPNHSLCFSCYIVRSGRVARRAKKHALLTLQCSWCLLTLLVIFQDQEHRVTVENVFFLTGQNEKDPELFVFLPCRKKTSWGP